MQVHEGGKEGSQQEEILHLSSPDMDSLQNTHKTVDPHSSHNHFHHVISRKQSIGDHSSSLERKITINDMEPEEI